MGVPKFLICPEMFLEIKSTFGKETKVDERSILDSYSNCPLLVLDDLATEKVSDWSRTDLYILINHRYLSMLPTIITSNRGLNEIAEMIDDRLASRFNEMGMILKLTGKDHRVQK